MAEVINISKYVDIKRESEIALCVMMLPFLSIILTIFLSVNYIQNVAIFLFLTIINLLNIIGAFLICKYVHKGKLQVFPIVIVYSYFLLPYFLQLLLVLPFQKYITSGFSQFLKAIMTNGHFGFGYFAFITIVTPCVILFIYNTTPLFKNKDILKEFELPKETRSVSNFSKNKINSKKIIFFFIDFFVLICFIVSFIGFGIIAFIISRGRFAGGLGDTYFWFRREAKTLFSKAKLNITSGFMDMLKKDLRSPILWIRSFKDDNNILQAEYRFEEIVVAELKKWGPVIAIGNSKEKYPLIGASREYFDDTKWIYAIDALIKGSGFIVNVLGRTKGLANEYDKIIKNNHSDKLIVLIPKLEEGELKERWIFFKNKFELKEQNDKDFEVTDRLLLFTINNQLIEWALYCDVKTKLAYRLAFNKILTPEFKLLDKSTLESLITDGKFEKLIKQID